MNGQIDLILRGGRIVDADGIHTLDLAIGGGRIAARLDPATPTGTADVLDISGRYVLPGLIDAHVHFREPGMTWKEDFESGTRSAAAGGVTTALVMPTDDPWTVCADDLLAKRAMAAGRIYCDIGLQAAVRKDGAHLREAAAARPVSFEIFTADVCDDFLHDSMAQLSRSINDLKDLGVPIAASPGDQSILCEALARLKPGRSTPADFVASRPALAEAAGIARIILAAAATGARVHIRQINSKQGIEVFRRLRHLADVTVETSPQNWTFTQHDYGRLGACAKASPPFRHEEDKAAVLEALADGTIDIVVTDHAPHLLAEKEAVRDDFASIPGGFPGVQSLLPSLLALVAENVIGLSDVARLTAARPASIFRLGHKGRLHAGYDADLIILDPNGSTVVKAGNLLGKSRYTPFEGTTAPFQLERVFLRGVEIVRDGVVSAGASGHILTSGDHDHGIT